MNVSIAEWFHDVSAAVSETDLYTATLPANLLSKNGDRLDLELTVSVEQGSAAGNILRVYLHNRVLLFHDGAVVSPRTLVLKLWLVRVSPTAARVTAVLCTGPVVSTVYGAINDLDFTANQGLRISGQWGGPLGYVMVARHGAMLFVPAA